VSVYDELRAALEADRPVALATVINGPGTGSKLLVGPDLETVGTLGNEHLDRVVARDALGQLDAGRTDRRNYGAEGQPMEFVVDVFIEAFAPPPRMLIFGAVDFTAALASAATFLGFHVTVCDAREVFATERRFPMADEVVVDWPHRLVERVGDRLGPADAICVLTHDTKFDVPAIVAAFATDVGYLGAMGSRRTHEKRVERLRDEGVTDEQLARVHAPIGLDIGSRTPEETAISICAEIIAHRTGHTSGSLRATDGPIH
jgi:xanthine dehydrogenase accessory factor